MGHGNENFPCPSSFKRTSVIFYLVPLKFANLPTVSSPGGDVSLPPLNFVIPSTQRYMLLLPPFGKGGQGGFSCQRKIIATQEIR